jgi:gamma-resorcylate decarboxylase
MGITDQKVRITRRTFLESSSTVFAAATLAGVGTPKTAPDGRNGVDAAKSDPAPISGKIALEEHFALPEAADSAYQIQPTSNFRLRMEDVGETRIAEMDRGGVEFCILSHVGPGIQGIPNTSQAVATARHWNDYLAEHIAKNPKRLKGFAALPMQDPQAASQELTRCIKELGFCGGLVHGFSQVGEADSAVFYDLPQYRPFWATVQDLGVPFYLHPRAPLSTRRQDYEGHPWLVGSVWGFTVETTSHALRLMGSGLFDEYPKLKILLGHLGEGLPFNIWRVDHRLSKLGLQTRGKRSISQYLRENFYVTTSGMFRTPALTDTMLEIGADRILYSVDYPYEDMRDARDWFDQAPISEADHLKIAHRNARELFHI